MAFTRTASGALHRQPARDQRPARRWPTEDVLRAARAATEWAGEAPLLFGGDLNLRPAEDPSVFERAARATSASAAPTGPRRDRPPAVPRPRGARAADPPGRRSGASCRSTAAPCASPTTPRSQAQIREWPSRRCCGDEIVDTEHPRQTHQEASRDGREKSSRPAKKRKRKPKRKPARGQKSESRDKKTAAKKAAKPKRQKRGEKIGPKARSAARPPASTRASSSSARASSAASPSAATACRRSSTTRSSAAG